MKTHILLVEDEVKIATLLALDLCDAGYHVTVAHDGIEGWNQAYNHPPDLIVLDWQLPHLTGLDICTRLRAAGQTMPILFASAYEDQTLHTMALQSGANGFLVKPFSSDMLLTKIAEQFEAL